MDKKTALNRSMTMVFVLSLVCQAKVLAEIAVNIAHPLHLAVKEGDTLGAMTPIFLENAQGWSKISQGNPKTDNTNSVYSDNLQVRNQPQKVKVIKLKPKVHKTEKRQTNSTIASHVVQPFLTKHTILQAGQFKSAGHVISGVNGEQILGQYMSFYANGLSNETALDYQIFRIGKPLRHPKSKEVLGIEGVYLGQARVLTKGEITKLTITSSSQEILPEDKLIPTPIQTPTSYYQPHKPENAITGWILHAPKGAHAVAKLDVVVISGGQKDGLETGHVVKAMRSPVQPHNPTSQQPDPFPKEESGLLLIVRVFDKLSYAVVVESNHAIFVGDMYQSP